jgi:Tol biopolymer transport system component
MIDGNEEFGSASRNQNSGRPLESERLTSWKEIASFLGRDARTVQRWEKAEGLPVHRHRHQKLDSIYAYRSELRAWQQSRSAVTLPEPPKLQVGPENPRNGNEADQEQPQPLEVSAGRTHADVRRSHPYRFPVLLALLATGNGLLIAYRTTRKPLRSDSEDSLVSGEYNPVPLASDPGEEYVSSFSPDGRRIAFVWNGEYGTNFDIYTKVVGAQLSTRLTFSPQQDYSPVWSPDGQSIAFCRETQDGGSSIFIMPSSGGPEKKLIDLTTASSPLYRDLSWSPDGEWIAVAATPKSGQVYSHGLYLLGVHSGQIRQISFPGPEQEDLFPSFSWHGRRLAFTRDVGRGVSFNLLLRLNPDMSPDGEPAGLLRSGFDGDFAGSPVWTPDDRQILFSSNRGGLYRLWMVPVDNPGPVRLLGSMGENIHVPAISSNGTLAFSHRLSRCNIWRIEARSLLAGKQVHPALAIASTREEDSPKVSPDGQHLAFVSDRSGFKEIWESKLDGSDAVALTSMNSVGVGSPAWSPDGQSIAFDARISGKPDIYTLSLSGDAKPARITADASSNVVPAWSVDGRSLYFSSSRSGSRQVWKIALATGQTEQITRAGGFAVFPAPDGKTVFYTKDRTAITQLWQLDLRNGAEKMVIPALTERGCAVSTAGIYYFSGDLHRAAVLNYYRFSTGTSTQLLKLGSPTQLSPGLSPDGSLLFYGQRDQNGFDLMMVKNFWPVSH